MGRSQSFEGMRMSVKLDTQTLAHVTKASQETGASRDAVLRDWVQQWRSLANLPLGLYRRLLYAAQRQRVPLHVLVNEALVNYCLKLPDVPPKAAAGLETPIDLLDEDRWLVPDEPPSRSTKRR